MPGSVFKYALIQLQFSCLSGEEDADPQGYSEVTEEKNGAYFSSEKTIPRVMESICKSHY